MAKKKENKEEIKGNLHSEIDIDVVKKEIVEYAIKEVDDKIEELVKKTDKRIIGYKNKSIFKRNILIILLLVVSLFQTYLLYDEGYFDKYFNHNTVSKENNLTNNTITENSVIEDEKENNFETLKKEYSYLLDNYLISEDNNYLTDFYSGKLTNKLKLSFSLINLSSQKIEQDEDMYIVKEEDLKEVYSALFGIDKYKATAFSLNNIDIKYLKTGNMYIISKRINNKSNIQREIIDIALKDDILKITTIEGIIKNDILYNVVTKEEINKTNISLKDDSKKLTKVIYTFEKDNNSYILSNVEV